MHVVGLTVELDHFDTGIGACARHGVLAEVEHRLFNARRTSTPRRLTEPRGIVTTDGALHEVDLLVYATGFDARAYVRPLEVVGAGGVILDEVWADGPMAYRSVAVPGFPNMFMMMGPHSPIGNQSLIPIAEDRRTM